jgi:YD repeat-containing protein
VAKDLRRQLTGVCFVAHFHRAAIVSFDAWDNLIGRDGLYWNEDNIVGEQIYEAHNRDYSWSYDADGRLISMSEPPPNEFTFVPMTHTYDAAGRHVKNTQTISRESQLPGNPVQTTMTYDSFAPLFESFFNCYQRN